jgi:hypothetical protein
MTKFLKIHIKLPHGNELRIVGALVLGTATPLDAAVEVAKALELADVKVKKSSRSKAVLQGKVDGQRASITVTVAKSNEAAQAWKAKGGGQVVNLATGEFAPAGQTSGWGH